MTPKQGTPSQAPWGNYSLSAQPLSLLPLSAASGSPKRHFATLGGAGLIDKSSPCPLTARCWQTWSHPWAHEGLLATGYARARPQPHRVRKWGHGRGRQGLSLTYAKLAKWASLPLCYITLSLWPTRMSPLSWPDFRVTWKMQMPESTAEIAKQLVWGIAWTPGF